MQVSKYLLIAIIAVSAIASINSSAYGQSTSASVQSKGSTNIFNITVDCGNGTQQAKHAKSHGQINVNLNVTCSGGVGQRGPQGIPGMTGPQGLPGKNGLNGQNATITIETTNGTVITTGNVTQQPQGPSPIVSPLSPPLIAH